MNAALYATIPIITLVSCKSIVDLAAYNAATCTATVNYVIIIIISLLRLALEEKLGVPRLGNVQNIS